MTDNVTSALAYTETDKAALQAVADAGITSAAAISETHIPDAGELHNRLQTVEGRLALIEERLFNGNSATSAILRHLLGKYFPSEKIGDILEAHNNPGPSEVIDKTATAR